MILGPYTQAQTELLQLRYLDFRTSRRMHSFLTNHWRKSDPQSVDILLFSSIHLSHNDRTGWRFLHVQLSTSSPGCQVFLSLGVFTWENSHRCEFHTGMTFWFRIAFTWWLGHFISRYLEIHFMLIKYTWFKIANIRHALPFPVYQQTDFKPKRVDVSRLHDTVARFRTGVKFSPRYKNRSELTPGWLAPAWHFVVVSCKQI